MNKLYSLGHICQNTSVTETVTLNVLFFGATADVTGARSAVFEFAAGTTSAGAVRAVVERHPRLGAHKLLISVNRAYANGDEQLNTGDELAVFTAVSGG